MICHLELKLSLSQLLPNVQIGVKLRRLKEALRILCHVLACSRGRISVAVFEFPRVAISSEVAVHPSDPIPHTVSFSSGVAMRGNVAQKLYANPCKSMMLRAIGLQFQGNRGRKGFLCSRSKRLHKFSLMGRYDADRCGRTSGRRSDRREQHW